MEKIKGITEKIEQERGFEEKVWWILLKGGSSLPLNEIQSEGSNVECNEIFEKIKNLTMVLKIKMLNMKVKMLQKVSAWKWYTKRESKVATFF